MIQLRFDERGQVKQKIRAVSGGDSIPITLIATDDDIAAADDSALTLSLAGPVNITGGVTTIGFGADSFSLDSDELGYYSIGIGLNSLASIISAGGVEVSPRKNSVHIRFLEVGARDPLTISHSAAGSLTGRCITLESGSVTEAASFLLDLSVDVLATVTADSDIAAADISISTTVSGDASTNQVQTITLTKTPDAGKFQLWVSGSSTYWLRPDASAYEVETALDCIAEDEFTVSRREVGEAIAWILTRNDKGALAAVTLSETLIGPVGVSMTLDLSTVREVMEMTDAGSAERCLLTFKHDGITRFSTPIDMRPFLARHAAIA